MVFPRMIPIHLDEITLLTPRCMERGGGNKVNSLYVNEKKIPLCCHKKETVKYVFSISLWIK